MQYMGQKGAGVQEGSLDCLVVQMMQQCVRAYAHVRHCHNCHSGLEHTCVVGEDTIIDCSAVGYLHVGKAASHKKEQNTFSWCDELKCREGCVLQCQQESLCQQGSLHLLDNSVHSRAKLPPTSFSSLKCPLLFLTSSRRRTSSSA